STATTHTDSYTLSLHDALPILGLHLFVNFSEILQSNICTTACGLGEVQKPNNQRRETGRIRNMRLKESVVAEWQKSVYLFQCSRSEEHTSELQSRENLVCRLLL